MIRRDIIQLTFALHFTVGNPAFAQKTVIYQPDNSNLANPERGFYSQSWLFLGERLSAFYLKNLRVQENVTLIRIPFRVPDFRDKPFSEEVLTTIEEAFNAAREAGIKVIPRIAYSYGSEEPDAPLDIVLQHIQQLKPILRKHGDVIAFMNAGFIGAWGEWHSSSNELANDNQARKAILFALLDALPPDRMVNLRYNYHKRPIFGTDQPLTKEEAFNGSKRARTGGLNDCFRASFYDVGTYTWQGDIEGEKDYLSQDNRFVPQSGETCGQSEYSDCATSLKDLERMRWDALNRDYEENVLNDWKDQGCYPAVNKKLGYRFVLESTEVLSASLSAGQMLRATVKLRNEGWGKAYNPRRLELILRNQQSGKVTKISLDQDPRRWLIDDGVISLAIKKKLPNNVADGTYELLLNLPDPAPSLSSRPEYSIRLANQDTWEAITGYNKLNTTVTVTNQAPPFSDNGAGLGYALYNNRNLSGPASKMGTDATVNFNWKTAGKETGLPKNNFSVRWTGQVQPEFSEAYTFYTRADDGTRLWVNGELLIDDWTNHAVREKSGKITLQAGQKYDIKLEYFENGGKAVCKLLWKSTSQSKQVIPQAHLYPDSDVTARTFTNFLKRPSDEPQKLGEAEITVYPNPVGTEGLTVVLPESVERGTVSIVNLSGQELLRQPFVGASLSLARRELSPGTYVIRIITKQFTHTQSMIIP